MLSVRIALRRKSIGSHVGKTHQRNDKCYRHTGRVGHCAHEEGTNGTPDGGHHEQRRSTLGERTQALKRQGKYGGKHDAFEYIDEHQGAKRNHAQIEHHEESGDKSADGTHAQHGFASDVLHHETARHAA